MLILNLMTNHCEIFI